MPSVAVIVGSSQGIGLQLARIYLSQTKMNVVALSRNSKAAREAILDTSSNGPIFAQSDRSLNFRSPGAFTYMGDKETSAVLEDNRLTAMDVDVKDENSIQRASEQVEKKFGTDSVRLILNVAGMLHPEKNLAHISYDEMLAQFQLNTFAPMLTAKHFAPLLHTAKTLKTIDDESNGLLPHQHSIFASLSARVGSINDNQRGGWYSYRASKAAQNQFTKTVSMELARSKSPAICVGLHPGTVRTSLSKDFTGGPGAEPRERATEAAEERRGKGEFEADESASLLAGLTSRFTMEDSGRIWDYSGKVVPY